MAEAFYKRGTCNPLVFEPAPARSETFSRSTAAANKLNFALSDGGKVFLCEEVDVENAARSLLDYN